MIKVKRLASGDYHGKDGTRLVNVAEGGTVIISDEKWAQLQRDCPAGDWVKQAEVEAGIEVPVTADDLFGDPEPTGKPRDEVIQNLVAMPGVGVTTAEKLVDAGFTTISEVLSPLNRDKVIAAIGAKAARRICEE